MKKIIKIQIKHLFIAVSFVLICSSNNGPVTQIENDTSGSIECFEEFIIRFKSDSLFQKERIKFPLKWTTYILSKDKFEEYAVLKEQWNYEKFEDRDQPGTFDRYSIEIEKIKRDKIHLIKKGIDNGIRIVYSFNMQGDIWTLEQVIDYST